MGIAGLIWIIIAYICKRNLRFFLMYNICQSMVISIILTIITLVLNIVMSILALIPFINLLAAKLNYLISLKIITTYPPVFSLSIFQFIIILILAYIIAGVIFGRIFYVPLLTNLMQKVMRSYK